ncbi:MAG TPA: hypothetical protein EYP59_06455, partial [Thiotrichaceae bacterium]|nr:hypothetical protein [Thiotrichaceae bacterium]
CVSPDTLVITENKIKEIKDVHNPDKLIGYLNDFSLCKLMCKVHTKRKNVFNINNSLIASAEHKIFTFNENGFREKMVKDLTKDDYLILPRKLEVKEKRIKIPNFEVGRIKKVSKLTKKLAQFLGYYYGDGDKSFCNNRIRIRDKNLKLLRYYGKILEDVFGLKPKIENVKKDKGLFPL